MESKVPVWVDEARCKGCDICVSLCPAGVLSMRLDAHKVLGKVIEVSFPDSCIGCRECELHCPDFAIFVAEKGGTRHVQKPEGGAGLHHGSGPRRPLPAGGVFPLFGVQGGAVLPARALVLPAQPQVYRALDQPAGAAAHRH